MSRIQTEIPDYKIKLYELYIAREKVFISVFSAYLAFLGFMFTNKSSWFDEVNSFTFMLLSAAMFSIVLFLWADIAKRHNKTIGDPSLTAITVSDYYIKLMIKGSNFAAECTYVITFLCIYTYAKDDTILVEKVGKVWTFIISSVTFALVNQLYCEPRRKKLMKYINKKY